MQIDDYKYLSCATYQIDVHKRCVCIMKALIYFNYPHLHDLDCYLYLY